MCVCAQQHAIGRGFPKLRSARTDTRVAVGVWSCVCRVGGAAAAAATNMRVPSLLPTASGMYGLGSQVVHAHAHSHGTQSILAMSTHSAAPTYHNMTHTSSGALGTVPVPLRMMQGKFQFTIPSSADRQKRGPMSVSSTQSNVM